MRITAVFILIWSLFWGLSAVSKDDGVFRFHLHDEPYTLDPMQVHGSTGGFLFSNLYRSLFFYKSGQGLQPDGAKKCKWVRRNKKALLLNCVINTEKQWSDGQKITAKDYERAFKEVFNPQRKSTKSELLLALKNARKILKGEVSFENLGVKAITAKDLSFFFDEEDLEFMYKLSDPTFAPRKQGAFPDRKLAHQLITNGPYQIKKWDPGKRIHLTPNPHYSSKSKARPEVEVLFVNDDVTALNLFDVGRLNLLRRVDTNSIPLLKKRPQFFDVSMARFDYIGFGPELTPYPHLREAMVLSLKYTELQKLYNSKGTPGCPSFPKSYMTTVPCLKFNYYQMKKALKKANPEALKKRWTFMYSKRGGESLKTGMEWVQNQWKKHLGLQVELMPMEQGMYLQTLATKPPAIFRKGGNLNRPTCLAGLEIFSKNHPENYIQLNNKKFEHQLLQLKQNPQRQHCTDAVKALLNTNRYIPQGPFYMSMMRDQKFKGWNINELLRLDLSDLFAVSK